jgi:hypothetical protein
MKSVQESKGAEGLHPVDAPVFDGGDILCLKTFCG